MRVLKTEGTPTTPYIHFNGNEGVLEIIGRSIPENAFGVFQELNSLIDEYGKQPKEILDVTISFEYFNTATARELMPLFRKFKDYPTKVTWYYEKGDMDMYEAGNDYNDILKTIPFTFLELEE